MKRFSMEESKSGIWVRYYEVEPVVLELMTALKFAINQYGRSGGPWNVPSDPGGWLDMATKAVAKAEEIL